MAEAVHVVGVRATPRELRPAIRAWPRLRWWATAPILWLGGCVLVAAIVLYRVPMPDVAVYWMGGLWLAALYGLIGTAMFAQARIRAMANGTPVGAAAGDWRVDEVGLTISGPVIETRLAWEAVVLVREEKDRLVFAVSPNANFVLPRRMLTPEQARDLTALIAEARGAGRLGRGAA